MSRTGIFHFYFIALTLIIVVQSLVQTQTYLPWLSISPSNFTSDHQENQKARVLKDDVADTTLELQRAARFETRQLQGLSNCPEERQDQRPPLGSASRHDRS